MVERLRILEMIFFATIPARLAPVARSALDVLDTT